MPRKPSDTVSKVSDKSVDLQLKRDSSEKNASFLKQDAENSLVFEAILYIGVLAISCGQNYTLHHMPYTRSFINNHPMFPSYAEYLSKNNITINLGFVATYLNLPPKLVNTFYLMMVLLLIPFVKMAKRFYSIKFTIENIMEVYRNKDTGSNVFKLSVFVFVVHFGFMEGVLNFLTLKWRFFHLK